MDGKSLTAIFIFILIFIHHHACSSPFIIIMKGTKVQTLGGHAVVGAWLQLVAWAMMVMVLIRICAQLIDGLGLETQTASTSSYLSQASWVIVGRPVYSSAGLGYISP